MRCGPTAACRPGQSWIGLGVQVHLGVDCGSKLIMTVMGKVLTGRSTVAFGLSRWSFRVVSILCISALAARLGAEEVHGPGFVRILSWR